MIEGFKLGEDVIQFFDADKESGVLALADGLGAGPTGPEENGRLIYDDGSLFYSTNGTMDFAYQIAVIAGSPNITAADIFIV